MITVVHKCRGCYSEGAFRTISIIWGGASYRNPNDLIQSNIHCLFSQKAPSWMIVEGLTANLTLHVSPSIKYAYSTYYETDIAEKTKWNIFLGLSDDVHADDVQFLASVKRPRVVIIIGCIFVFQWFWFNFPWPRFYHVDFRHISPSKLWY